MKNSHRPKSQEIPRKRSGGGMLLGLFLGLVVGVLIAFGVVWYLNKTPLPFMDKTEGRGNGAKPAAAVPSAPAAPGATVPATAPAAAPAAPVIDARPVPTEIFFLQVGAFQKAADADNLKAKLALTGLEASVQEVSIPDKGVMHRVRVGPFRTPDEMNRARTLLSQTGVQGTVIKQKE